MKLLTMLPLLQTVFLLVFTVVWITYMTYLASSGELVTVQIDSLAMEFKQFEYSDNTEYAMWFMCFSFLWTSEFINAVGQIVNAGDQNIQVHR